MRHLAILLSLAVVAGAAACGRDAAGPGASLTPNEVQAVAGKLVFSSHAALEVWVPTQLVDPRPSTDQFRLNTPISCEAGGTMTPDIQVNVAYTGEPYNASVQITGTATAAGCAAPGDGQIITLTGTFNVAGQASISSSQPAGSQTLALKGTIDWRRTDGTRGTCKLDLTASGQWVGPSIKGTLCGRAVDLSSQLLRG